MDERFDAEEGRAPAQREADLFSALRSALARARRAAPHYAESLAAVEPTAVKDRDALARLPLLRKSALIAMQEATPPFGGVAVGELGAMTRLFLSPGPIAEPQGASSDVWGLARALFAAGFRKGQVVHNCFSYHLTPAGFMFDAACQVLDCPVFPGGIGATESQIQAMRRYRPSGYVGTPDYLKTLIERADALNAPVDSLRRALVSGGPLFPDLRAWYGARGIAVRQCYATADLGLIAYEDGEPADGMVVSEDCIVEIVRPGTGDPVAAGEVGEVVVSRFDAAYPLIRFATGDLSAVLEPRRPMARTNMRLKGWLGRADQTAKVKGLFVHPEQIARIAAAFPDLGRLRLTVTAEDGRDAMRLDCEWDGDDDALAARIAEQLTAETRLRGVAALVPRGSLPNDGKVIDDQRAPG